MEELLERLEAQVKAAEKSIPQTPENQMLRMAQLLERLERAQALGGIAPDANPDLMQNARRASMRGARPDLSAAGKAAEAQVAASTGGGSMMDYNDMFTEKCFGKIEVLMNVSKEVGNEGVIGAVNLYMEVFKSQSAVFNTMAICSKPADVQFMTQIARDKKKDMIALEKKNRKFMNHIRCVEDSLNLFAWFMIPNDDKEAYLAQLTDFYGAIDFIGTKLQNDDLEKKWYRSFRDV